MCSLIVSSFADQLIWIFGVFFVLALQLYSNNKIKRNNAEDATKTLLFSFSWKTSYWLKNILNGRTRTSCLPLGAKTIKGTLIRSGSTAGAPAKMELFEAIVSG